MGSDVSSTHVALRGRQLGTSFASLRFADPTKGVVRAFVVGLEKGKETRLKSRFKTYLHSKQQQIHSWKQAADHSQALSVKLHTLH